MEGPRVEQAGLRGRGRVVVDGALAGMCAACARRTRRRAVRLVAVVANEVIRPGPLRLDSQPRLFFSCSSQRAGRARQHGGGDGDVPTAHGRAWTLDDLKRPHADVLEMLETNRPTENNVRNLVGQMRDIWVDDEVNFAEMTSWAVQRFGLDPSGVPGDDFERADALAEGKQLLYLSSEVYDINRNDPQIMDAMD